MSFLEMKDATLLFPAKNHRAFSLVEVAIAMGIVAFAIVSLIGLMGVSLDAGRRANDDTQVAMLARKALGQFLTTPYSSLSNQVIYFDQEGELLSSSADAYFECDTKVNDTGVHGGVTVTMTFRWPVGASHQPTSAYEQVFPTFVAAY